VNAESAAIATQLNVDLQKISVDINTVSDGIARVETITSDTQDTSYRIEDALVQMRADMDKAFSAFQEGMCFVAQLSFGQI
jgi:hypothetical protein